MRCPYDHPVGVTTHSDSVQGYCDGEASRRLGVATLYEETRYRTAGQHTVCPVFPARQAQTNNEEDICISEM